MSLESLGPVPRCSVFLRVGSECISCAERCFSPSASRSSDELFLARFSISPSIGGCRSSVVPYLCRRSAADQSVVVILRGLLSDCRTQGMEIHCRL